jgi:hypothetical protein
MAIADFTDWMNDFTQPDVVWYIKRLSANDTLANGAHQAGPYVPRRIILALFPDLEKDNQKNPRAPFNLRLDSHADQCEANAIWYNNKLFGGTRNEGRLTNFGGKESALLNPDSTGALTIFAFVCNPDGTARYCHSWVCRSSVEEELAEDRFGTVEPGQTMLWSPLSELALALAPPRRAARNSCRLTPAKITAEWGASFPTGAEIIRKAVELRPHHKRFRPDERLLRRRACEYEMFLSVEEAIELPVIKAGFTEINEFVARAQTILQRRKARSGRSLELHAKAIFIEEGLRESIDFSHGADAEPGRSPDFLFPSQASYRDPTFPASRLRMLAVKTTCRDRWRQILNEAARIETKHLLTLQEGVSVGQFAEMKSSGVQLVAPSRLIKKYPKDIRGQIISVEEFILEVRSAKFYLPEI